MFAAYMDMRYSRNMARDEAREKVIPAYMGLIKQIDDQMGVLMRFLEERGLLDTTMIVFTSDHGDYLGDHWMGEKDLFHEQSAKIPLIVIDPSREADGTRGTRQRRAGRGDRSGADLHRLFRRQGAGPHSRRALADAAAARRDAGRWRKVVFSEYDYSMQDVRLKLNQPIEQCRLFMVFDGRWKYIHASGFRPMLYDLRERSAGIRRPRRRSVRARMSSRGCRPRCSTGRCIPRATSRRSNEKIAAYADNQLQIKGGILIGIWDEAELAAIRQKIGMRAS